MCLMCRISIWNRGKYPVAGHVALLQNSDPKDLHHEFKWLDGCHKQAGARPLRLAGLDWPVPDYSTLCRRQKTLKAQLPYRPAGQWTVRISSSLATRNGRPARMMFRDGAHDTRGCYSAIIARFGTAIIPIRKNGRPWNKDCSAARARTAPPCAPRVTTAGRSGNGGRDITSVAVPRPRCAASSPSARASPQETPTARPAKSPSALPEPEKERRSHASSRLSATMPRAGLCGKAWLRRAALARLRCGSARSAEGLRP